ncbi:hypothetical protein KKG90_05690, partial [Candidatus Bipolaricaulota bacterium]|nr:hypothetical protein [Candidatus Bipolaricaulota bacterium]
EDGHPSYGAPFHHRGGSHMAVEAAARDCLRVCRRAGPVLAESDWLSSRFRKQTEKRGETVRDSTSTDTEITLLTRIRLDSLVLGSRYL